MRRVFSFMLLALTASGLSAIAAESQPPASGSIHRIQVYRVGEGNPRQRDPAPARHADSKAAEVPKANGRTRPYQPAKPGEGAAKG